MLFDETGSKSHHAYMREPCASAQYLTEALEARMRILPVLVIWIAARGGEERLEATTASRHGGQHDIDNDRESHREAERAEE